MDWTDEVIERLRGFWTEGLSTAEIGRRVGVSKNAVVGKVHRLGLTARPSPIRRGGSKEATPRPPARRAVLGPTLPPLSELPGMQALPPAPSPAPRARPPLAVTPAPASPTLRAVARAPGGRVIPCCWPIGEPGTRGFRFCGSASAGGKPYCAEHAALAYVKIRDRREDAA